MMVKVVMSKVTRVPETSFSLSTLVRTPTTYLGPLLALTITVGNRVIRSIFSKKTQRIVRMMSNDECNVTLYFVDACITSQT